MLRLHASQSVSPHLRAEDSEHVRPRHPARIAIVLFPAGRTLINPVHQAAHMQLRLWREFQPSQPLLAPTNYWKPLRSHGPCADLLRDGLRLTGIGGPRGYAGHQEARVLETGPGLLREKPCPVESETKTGESWKAAKTEKHRKSQSASPNATPGSSRGFTILSPA
jgi:hypothetical protein